MRALLLLLTLAPAAVSAQNADVPSAAGSVRYIVAVGAAASVPDLPAGVSVSVARRPVSALPWSFPVEAQVSALIVGNGDGNYGGILAAGGAIQAARRLGRSVVYVRPGVQLSGGIESVGPENVFVGVRPSLDLVRYPARRGLVAAIGVYGIRRFGSDILNDGDVGVSLTLGAQF